jgi:hypothetical protein
MNSSITRSRRSLCYSAVGALLALSGCSLLYNFNIDQCDKEGESCRNKGPQFEYAICKNHVCVQMVAVGGSGATGGQSSTSSTGGDAPATGGAADTGGSSPLGSTGGAATTGGAANTGGTAPGTGGTQPCDNATCVSQGVSPHTCINGQCVQLQDENCPVLIPAKTYRNLLKEPSPIIIGGFASITNTSDQHDTIAIINWDLAFDEFNSNALGGQGLPSWDGSGKPRPLIGLICQGVVTDQNVFSATMKHLAQDIKVPGILSSLSANDLYNAFAYTTSGDYIKVGGKPVFFMSTNSADYALANLQDNGLVWHMLGASRQLAATTAALLKRMEPVVQQQRQALWDSNGGQGPDDPSTPLRVTLVYSDYPQMVDMRNVLETADSAHPEALLTFNNASALDPTNNGCFREVKISSAKIVTSPDVTPATNDIVNNPPHIIVAMATSEFPKSVIPYVENMWGSKAQGRIRPYYLMSHLIYGTPELLTTLKNQLTSTSIRPLETRLAGVNYAQTQDDHTKKLYNDYVARLQASYDPNGDLYNALPGWENQYDAAYYLLYSVAAAAVNTPSFTGTDIFTGLKSKVIYPGAPSVDIGPKNIQATISSLNVLSPPYAMSLWGTMGSPNFDMASGTRNTATSAWCTTYDATLTTPAWVYVFDGLLYDTTTNTLKPPASGVPSCLQAYNN